MKLLSLILVVIITIIIIYIIRIIHIRSYNDTFNPKETVPEDEQIVVLAPKKRIPITAADYQQAIPKILIQTNESDVIPVNMKNSIQTILNDNPEYEYYYYDDKGARQFIESYYDNEVLNAYDTLIPGAYKADLFRYCFLYQKGGVYIDSGMVSREPLKNIIEEEDRFISPEDNGGGRRKYRIYNAFMAAVPRHPIIGKAIDISVSNIMKRKYGKDPLDVTGPSVLGRAFHKVIGKEPIIPDKKYTKNTRIIRFVNTNKKTGGGEISSNGIVFLNTKYDTYYNDSSWYHTNEHYSRIWNGKNVFGEKIKSDDIIVKARMFF